MQTYFRKATEKEIGTFPAFCPAEIL